ncbi:putative ATPase/DNA-binding SARP family transcriptional activator/tetratricopeptide (TPR) repeat protein [Actinoplanes lutulentus]|uniref:Putative ATPase n=1 Tax=Actinoplanes lutulentus TaxID=1287878 RepID=A0A327YU43_9ACTN|nr:BTAD domain-containing putative transcriptional regulator [Actinoplanes lutulentus]MBB2947117.1 putative ATPase/DNA-binding SARP family transcriptional activator/tetratricopeptide (TPR) repeat protein [Actinoplanes lutulentus]RAK24677.1 putative ATPase [Actinoplanes lutulentus]
MQIGVLGSFEVRAGDGVLADIPGARLRALLIALALDPGRIVPKTTLLDWIWGDDLPAEATNALHRLVSRLRKALPDGLIEGHTDGYRLTVDPDAVDAVRFQRLITAGRPRDALALWRGAPFADAGLPDGIARDTTVARLDELRLVALEDVGTVTELTGLVAEYPMRERLAAALMRALVAAGRGNEALLVFERTKEALADALGADPSPELSGLHVALLRGDVGRPEQERRTNLRAELTNFVGKSDDIAAVRELVAGRRLTTLIGPGGSGKTRLATETARTLTGDLPDGAWLVELAAISASQSGSRETQGSSRETTGSSRETTGSSDETQGRGRETPSGGGGDVAQAAITALGLRDALLAASPHTDLTDRLISAIRDREMLLVLDNCEHLIEAAADFAHRLLGECRRLRIVATSREPLGITGEALWRVEPLAVPGRDATADEIEGSPAVQLLLERAGAVRTDLAPDLSVLARVCRALDGMPLAIELAAARLRTMSLDQLAARLDDRFRLLNKGSRTAQPQHRTLRAVVDWSWELLTEHERMVLRRLAVFSGGASLEAAERVCSGGGVEPDDVLELITSLAEKSLLVTSVAATPRYRMLGTILEYAAQRLAEAGEQESARHAHLAWFTELAETAEPHLRRADQLTWLAVLEAEHDNIGAAMRGALAAGEAYAAMRLAAGAGWYWWLSGRKAEGAELIIAATETSKETSSGTPGDVPDDVPDEIRATVYALVVLYAGSGRADEHQAAEWINKAFALRGTIDKPGPLLNLVVPLERLLRSPQDSLPAWENLLQDQDPWVRALARLHLGKTRINLGQTGREADEYLETALAEFRALGERFGIYFALTELADRIATRGDLATACDHYEQAITVVTEAGAIEDVIQLRARQAQLYWLLGDEAASAAALAEAQRCAQRVTWPDALAELAITRAELARWRGDLLESRSQLDAATAILGDKADQPTVRAFTESLRGLLTDDLTAARSHHTSACEAAAEAGHAALIAAILVGVADLALLSGSEIQAARLLGASAGMRGLKDGSNPDVARIERAARNRLGDEGFAEAVREGTLTGWRQLAEITLTPAS